MRQTRPAPAAHPPAATEPLYAPLDFVLVRAPLLPVEAYQALSAAPRRPDDAAPAAPGPLGAAGAALQDPRVRPALAVGSPALLAALDRAEQGRLNRRDTARLRAKLLRYLIRMATRPTPYGLFAGVALGWWGRATDLALAATPGRTRTRPDMAWLLALVQQAEARIDVRRHLRLVANTAALRHGGRLFLAERAPPVESSLEPVVSVRATTVAQRALALARSPIPYEELVAALLSATPGATPDKVERLLTELWQQTFLLTDLRPPLTTDSPARHVAERLAGIPAAADLLARLREVLQATAAWDALPPADRIAAYSRLAETAGAVVEAPGAGEAPFQVDMALALRGGALAAAVGRAAARAAEILLRVSPWPQGPPTLAAYRQAFLNRYGPEREVPLLELLHPDLGLGRPAVHGAAPPLPAAQAARRAQTLLDLACRALHDREQVIELTEDTLRRLETWVPDPATAPRSLDLYVFVAADSAAAVDAGAFQLIVGPNLGAPAAGRNLGRFADLLAPEGPAALARAAQAEQPHLGDRLAAELVYLHRRPRMANVTIRPAVRSHEITLGVTAGVPAARVIPLDELQVGVRAGRFYVRWPRGNTDVLVCAGHMLNTSNAPVVCRFLSDVSRDGLVQLSYFNWGPATDFPFLPRVQVDQIVLRPARWRLDRRLLPPDAATFPAALRRWREHWQAPRHVSLSVDDNRLILDLDDPGQAEEIRGELQSLGDEQAILLEEVLPRLDQVWTPGPGGRFITEFAVSLALRSPGPGAADSGARVGGIQAAPGAMRDPPPPAVEPPSPLTPAPAADRAPLILPPSDPAARLRALGSEWLFIKLYGPRAMEDDLIAGPLLTFTRQALAAGWAEDWFFLRYSDPDPHLRLRFRGPPARLLTDLLPALSAWATELMAAGQCLRFSFDTYERELERYGGGAGMEVAEAVFGADSRAVAALVQLLHQRRVALDRTALAVLTVDDLLAGLGLSEAARLAWCREVALGWHEAGDEYRRRKVALRALLGDLRQQTVEPQGARLAEILAERRAALAPCAARLARLAEHGELHLPLTRLCQSFVHLHCNRLVGSSRTDEQMILGLLWRTRAGLARAAPATEPRPPAP
jgi:thiopeptide-type bacteriocin biosynthesis protein